MASTGIEPTLGGTADVVGGSGDHASAISVFVLTTLMAFASALGALPYALTNKRTVPKSFAALANACACGVMLAASFDLVHEGQAGGPISVVFGLVVGAALISRAQGWLSERGDNLSFLELHGADARKTLMIVGIMAAHAFGEGCGVGVSFSGAGGLRQGRLVTLAIGAHNIPEGLAVANVLATKGIKPLTCAWWCVVTSLPQPLLALPAFLFVEMFQPLLPFSLGFAAGCMVWIVFAELLPDALAEADDPKHVATTITMSAGALELFRMLTEGMERYGSAASGIEGAGAGATAATEVGMVAGVYVPVAISAAMYFAPPNLSVYSVPPSTGLGFAASTMGVSACFRLLWALWRGVSGGASIAFVILGAMSSVLVVLLASRWFAQIPSLKDMRPWNDIDDDDARDVDIEGVSAPRRFGNVLFTRESCFAFAAASLFAVADGAHATKTVMENSWYTLLPALMRAIVRISAVVLLVVSTDRRPFVIGAVALVGYAFVCAASALGANHSSSGICIFLDTVASVFTLLFVHALKPYIVFGMMTKHGDIIAGISLGVAITVMFAVSTWAMCTGTAYCDIA
jgi:zinc transporter ZupT